MNQIASARRGAPGVRNAATKIWAPSSAATATLTTTAAPRGMPAYSRSAKGTVCGALSSGRTRENSSSRWRARAGIFSGTLTNTRM